jgi:hypothetical protein
VTKKADAIADSKPRVAKTVHATGELKSVAPGILEGNVTFPVRGDIRIRMERRPNDRWGGGAAHLFCLAPAWSDCTLALIEASIEENEPTDYWHGFLSIEGYLFQVRAVRDGKRMLISFLDAIQPMRTPVRSVA